MLSVYAELIELQWLRPVDGRIGEDKADWLGWNTTTEPENRSMNQQKEKCLCPVQIKVGVA